MQDFTTAGHFEEYEEYQFFSNVPTPYIPPAKPTVYMYIAKQGKDDGKVYYGLEAKSGKTFQLGKLLFHDPSGLHKRVGKKNVSVMELSSVHLAVINNVRDFTNEAHTEKDWRWLPSGVVHWLVMTPGAHLCPSARAVLQEFWARTSKVLLNMTPDPDALTNEAYKVLP